MTRIVWSEIEATARTLKANGKTNAEIAKVVGLKKSTVIRNFWERGMGGGKPNRRSEDRAPAPVFAEPSLRRFSWEQSV